MFRTGIVASLLVAAVCFAAAAHVTAAATRPVPPMPHIDRLLGNPQAMTNEHAGGFRFRCFWWRTRVGYLKECFVVGTVAPAKTKKRPGVPGA